MRVFSSDTGMRIQIINVINSTDIKRDFLHPIHNTENTISFINNAREFDNSRMFDFDFIHDMGVLIKNRCIEFVHFLTCSKCHQLQESIQKLFCRGRSCFSSNF